MGLIYKFVCFEGDQTLADIEQKPFFSLVCLFVCYLFFCLLLFFLHILELRIQSSHVVVD